MKRFPKRCSITARLACSRVNPVRHSNNRTSELSTPGVAIEVPRFTAPAVSCPWTGASSFMFQV
ncbi:uncharacterized protein QC761_0019740 [Podospora bellae-mahoneyi]|uniref:Uncharacterized protein n=1 Tax=Podospora bellae-mahoneyi TaxID=2093777 RepID=A0ABR0G0N7_9PEZI|nr:hypothetical protein QC761_0019740 [Podospora bellae-mahoneyi]